jgi:NADH-quinone oxidoreductase subunit J
VFALYFIGSAVLMVTSRNTIKAAMFLILSFFSVASLWILLEAEFLAITLILVYVGAVMVLFLFVIKMLDIDKSTVRAKFTKYLPLGIVVSVVVISQMVLILSAGHFDLDNSIGPVRKAADFSNISQLANDLYTLYVYPFELAAVLLLTAIIAAITLVHRKESRSKRQNIAEQVNVQVADRVRLVSASSSKSKESK